ncbi:hypothetical protein [Caulobacter sp. 17J65-9]|uniref:hypothetical protein n=1 Tax=Caulobacter sp. 17J65-9 TaxID=2709382 RepID=UPI0013CDAAB1|nr:hypothetical protein [Caulobacter sp. 17J65-9]NEX93814.1 hypothetical protein [Caulobacter sp. 17J65-9]
MTGYEEFCLIGALAAAALTALIAWCLGSRRGRAASQHELATTAEQLLEAIYVAVLNAADRAARAPAGDRVVHVFQLVQTLEDRFGPMARVIGCAWAKRASAIRVLDPNPLTGGASPPLPINASSISGSLTGPGGGALQFAPHPPAPAAELSVFADDFARFWRERDPRMNELRETARLLGAPL